MNAEPQAAPEKEEKKGGEGGEEEKKAEGVRMAKDMVVKKTLCKHWTTGTCQRGQWCGYVHGKEELGMQVRDPQGLKTTLCKYHEKGSCFASEECQFAHGVEELGQKKPAVPRRKGGQGRKDGKGKAGGRRGKDGKGKAGGRGGKGKTKDHLVPWRETRRARSDSKGSRRARRSDSRSSSQALTIIIQIHLLFFPLHQDKTSSASTLYN